MVRTQPRHNSNSTATTLATMVTTSELILMRQKGCRTTPPTSPSVLRHPNDVNLTNQMQRSVTFLNETFRPTNTARAHEPKIDEYYQFCDAIYGSDQYRYHLNFEKVYRFMYYQAFRPLKKRGGGKRTKKRNNALVARIVRRRVNESGEAIADGFEIDHDDFEIDDNADEDEAVVMRFDKELYDEVMFAFSGAPVSPGKELPQPQQPDKPMSWSSFEQYKQIIRKIYRVQKQEGYTGLDWDSIWQQALDDLAKQVKGRVPHVKKATYQEKVSSALSPYTIVERYQEIEEEFWKDTARAVGPRQLATQLRHRYCCQHTASGILRCESHSIELNGVTS